MAVKPTYEELEQRVKELEKEAVDLRQVEKELQQTRALLETAINQSPSGILIADAPDVRIRIANPAAFGIRGGLQNRLTEIDVTKHSARWQTFYPDGTPYDPKDLPLSKAVIRGEISKDVEVIIRHESGEERWVSANAAPIRDSNGDIQAGVVVFHDITERKQAERALRESEERYKSLFKNNHSVMLLIDPKTADIVDANPAAVSFYGWNYEVLTRKKISDINTLAKEQVFEEMKKAKMEQRKHFYFLHRLASGDIRDVEVYSGPIKVHGKELLYSIIYDITVRKKAEEEKAALETQLFHAQKMESIGTLSGGIAHDFNNLLGIILGNTEMAMEDIPERHPVKFNLDEIRTASLRARDVVKQLLSFGRKTDQKKRPVKLVQIIEDALIFLRSSIPTSIEIHKDIPNDADDTILADKTQINQVMINLFTNAAHAMEDAGGVITIGIQNVYLDQTSAVVYPDLPFGNYVKLTVKDTGTGIDHEVKDRIFDPYFTTKEVGKGLGIGLSVVHGIVRSHNGAIYVDSQLGKGTTFGILFPLAEEETAEETKADEKLFTGNERILLVDDEKSMVEIGRRRLERLGYQVEAKTNPIEALELFRMDPDQFDLVITDMTMPHITGDKLVEEILKICPDMPTILCTGFSERIDEEKAKKIGVRQYIEKPFDQGTLSKLVRKALDHP